jgi:hypothetical protein
MLSLAGPERYSLQLVALPLVVGGPAGVMPEAADVEELQVGSFYFGYHIGVEALPFVTRYSVCAHHASRT